MTRLGYSDRWAAQGGDWGAHVNSTLASLAPQGLLGIHLSGHAWVLTDEDRIDPDATEQQMIDRSERFNSELNGYHRQQSTRPQTVGTALADSPPGQAAWILEKYNDWTDNDAGPESLFTCDEMIDNIMLYWLPNAGASSARFYWEVAHSTAETTPVELPVAFTRTPRHRWTGPDVGRTALPEHRLVA